MDNGGGFHLDLLRSMHNAPKDETHRHFSVSPVLQWLGFVLVHRPSKLSMSASLFFLKILIYLSAAEGLSYSTGHPQSLLWHTESLVETYELLVVACGVYFPDQGFSSDPCIGSWSLSHWTTRGVPPSAYWVHLWVPSWVFIRRTDVEAETPILWIPDGKSWLIWKYLDAGKDWGQEEKGTTEDEMAGWHHWINGHAFRWTPGVGDGQGGLACCGSWGHEESDMTERLIELNGCLPVPRIIGENWVKACVECPSQPGLAR